jgi:hypothetical protein
MMNEETEARAFSGSSPLEHLKVAVGITRGENRAASEVTFDSDRFARAVINEVRLKSLLISFERVLATPGKPSMRT